MKHIFSAWAIPTPTVTVPIPKDNADGGIRLQRGRALDLPPADCSWATSIW